MAFEDGMRLGQQAYQFGVQEARLKQLQDAELSAKAAAEQRAAQAQQFMTEQAGKAEDAALGVDYAPYRAAMADGPPTAEAQAALPKQLALPTKTPAADSPEMASIQAMRLAAMARDAKAFGDASATNMAARRGQRYEQAAESIMKNPDEMIQAVNSASNNGMMVASMGGGSIGIMAPGADGKTKLHKLSSQQAKQFVVAQMMAKDGDLGGAFKLMEATNKELSDALKNNFERDFAVEQQAGTNRRADQTAAETRRHNLAVEQYNNTSLNTQLMRDAQQFIKPDGSVGYYYFTPDGTAREMQLPPGTKPFPRGGAGATPPVLEQLGLKPGQQPEVGVEYVGNDGVVRSYYGSGQIGPPGGVPVAERPEYIKKSGVDTGMVQDMSNAGRVGWHTDQKSMVVIDDEGRRQVFDISNPGEARAMNELLRKSGAKRISEDEIKKQQGQLLPPAKAIERFSLYKAKGPAPELPAMYRDPKWEQIERGISQVTGVPVEVLRGIRVNGERSNGDQVSPKGARGVYQFMPATRDLFLKEYGVDAYSADPRDQVMAAALHLRDSFNRTKSWTRAIAGYNGGSSGEVGTNKTKENKDYTQRVTSGLQLPNM